jgi:uncharacterized protein YycO
VVYTHRINGLLVQTGDLVCTTNACAGILPAFLWRLIGRLVPGPVGHVAIYVGPEDRFVEAGPNGVIAFRLGGETWAAERIARQRGWLVDELYGVARPLLRGGYSAREEARIRARVAAYCLAQAMAARPYNLNFFNSGTEAAFYCSQLAYKAYLPHGIDLNTDCGVPSVGAMHHIVFPQEIWNGSAYQRVPYAPAPS